MRDAVGMATDSEWSGRFGGHRWSGQAGEVTVTHQRINVHAVWDATDGAGILAMSEFRE